MVTNKVVQKQEDGTEMVVDIGAKAVNVETDDERQFVSAKEKAEWKKTAEAFAEMGKTISFVPAQSGSLTYTSAVQSPVWDIFDSEKLTLGGTTIGTDAGTYTATFTPKEGYKWSDGSKSAKNAEWKINRAVVSLPAQSGSLTYTGAAQSPVWTDYDSSKMTMNGTTTGTDAGTYTATFTPKENYQWSDGSTGAKSVGWTIGKAAGSLSLDKTSLDLIGGIITGTITATRLGDGVIRATSGNPDIAAVSVDGTKITVTGKKDGSATITVMVDAGTNYSEASGSISVQVEAISSTLADNTPSKIQAAARSGQAKNLWSVGDKVPIKLKGWVEDLELDGTYYAFILGFDHNSEIEGSNTIHFQFGKDADGVDIAFVSSLYMSQNSTLCMDRYNSNDFGWSGSDMHNTICKAFLAALTTEWQNVIVDCTKYSDNRGACNNDAKYVTATQDKIWLLGEFEVFGSRFGANSAEQNYQKQYDYYKSGNSKIKYKHNDTKSGCYWALRSASISAMSGYRVVSNGDTSSGNAISESISANISTGFAPGFMVA